MRCDGGKIAQQARGLFELLGRYIHPAQIDAGKIGIVVGEDGEEFRIGFLGGLMGGAKFRAHGVNLHDILRKSGCLEIGPDPGQCRAGAGAAIENDLAWRVTHAGEAIAVLVEIGIEVQGRP